MSLGPMMCMALTEFYEVNDNLLFTKEMWNILATLSCSINFRASHFPPFFPPRGNSTR